MSHGSSDGEQDFTESESGRYDRESVFAFVRLSRQTSSFTEDDPIDDSVWERAMETLELDNTLRTVILSREWI
jgi:hypothetical protein